MSDWEREERAVCVVCVMGRGVPAAALRRSPDTTLDLCDCTLICDYLTFIYSPSQQ